MEPVGKAGKPNVTLADRLRDPLQLRIFVVAALVLAWYVAAFGPLSAGIDDARRGAGRSSSHRTLAREVQDLRAAVETFRDRIPAKPDQNECAEYVLAGIRSWPLRVVKLEPKGPTKFGPYEVVLLKIEMTGSFLDLDAWLAWVESNRRLLRVDSLSVEPVAGGDGGVAAKVTLLAIMG